MVTLAVLGDLHGHFDDVDVATLSVDDTLDHVLVVGDLAGLRWSPTLAVARRLSRIRRPTLVVPGNHDTPNPVQLLGEVLGRPALGRPFSHRQERRLESLREAVAPHPLGAYSHHVIGDGDDAVTIIAGRPHSMGGPTLAFAPVLRQVHGVASLHDSADRLRALVDAAPTRRLVFLAHNGPTGLGEQRTDIWGRDFHRDEGDWGDPDLRAAIDHALATGREVLACVAGHMHRRLRGGGERVWQVVQDGVLYVNAAVVPRIHPRRGRHHVRLVLEGQTATAEDVWVPHG